MKKNSPHLYPYEWLIVALFCSAVLTLSLVSFMQSSREVEKVVEEAPYWIRSPLITITVEGAVEFPGEYQVMRGSSLEEALKWAVPLGEADLSKLKLNSSLQRKRKIRVPYRRKPLRNISPL